MKTKLIKKGKFSLIHILTEPQRIESKIIFDRDDISQKLIFTLMDITHDYGFACSSPQFKDPEDSSMIFVVGTFINGKIEDYTDKLVKCLSFIKKFADDFNKQLDFSKIDITMFSDVDVNSFYPEQIAAIRDQHFGGSWNEFRKFLLAEKKVEMADIIDRCKKFEKVNKKDIGYVGHKLNSIIEVFGNLGPGDIMN